MTASRRDRLIYREGTWGECSVAPQKHVRTTIRRQPKAMREPDTEIAMAGGYSLQIGAGVVRRRARDLSKPVITPGKGSNSRKH